jgi:hypothetical protein
MLRRLSLALLVLPLTGWVQLRVGDAGSPPLRWTSGFVVPYHVHSAGYSGLPIDRVRGAIDRAFATWQQPCSTLRFRADPNGADGDTPAMDGRNIIRFEEHSLPRDIDPETVLAYTLHVGVYCTGTITESDITFNAVTFQWSDRENTDRADIETVALHEIGHFLGLDHSPIESAVMYPSIIERVRRDLSPDDQNGLCAIYRADRGNACTRDADCGGGEVCILGGTSGGAIAPYCGAALGHGRAGQACNAQGEFCDNGCNNGMCLNGGVCSSLCRDDRDCPASWSCIPQPGEDGGPAYGLCLDVVTCESDVDECPDGQVCVPTRHPVENRVLRLCVDSAGRGQVGDACDDPDTCAGALCVSGRCSKLCDGDADCAGYACVPMRLSGLPADTNACDVAPHACGHAADCTAAQACAFVLDGDVSSTQCVPADGAPAGARCAGDGDCRSALCLPAGVCSDVCRDAHDCPADMTCGRQRVGRINQLACVPRQAPGADMGVPPERDAAAGPDRDAAPHPGRDAAAGPERDAGSPGPDSSGSLADAGGFAPDAVPPGPSVVVRRGGGGSSSSGCTAVDGPGAPWLLALLALRRRRPTARR